MKLSDDLAWRALIKDKTFANNSYLDTPKTFYLGIDAVSADSLTVGNLAIILLARRLVDTGWKAVLLMGGGTSLVGDPGGKNEERQLKSREEVAKNITGVKEQVTRLFAGQKYEIVDNYDWLSELKYIDFLREVGKHFSMSELMQREFVTERMGEGATGISYAEFSYSLIQGYDFWHLSDKYGVELQIGGSDQWGNMLSGVALIRKKEGKEVNALSMPLVVNKETGQKFGKSEGGAVWLDADRTTPTQFYQFWINTDDADVEEFLKVFTFLSKEKIERVVAEHKAKPEARVAQKVLAEEVTKLVHPEGGEPASGVTKYLTGQESLTIATEEELRQIRNEIPSVKVAPNTTVSGTLTASGIASSNSEARRLIESGGVYINGEKVETDTLKPSDFQNGRLLLRRGKAYKDSALVELE